MTKALVMSLVLLMPTSARAAEWTWQIAIVGSNLADFQTTQAAIARGGVEGNPLMPTTGSRIAVKAAMTTLEVVGIHKLWKENKAAAIGTAIGVIVLNGALAWNNTRVMR